MTTKIDPTPGKLIVLEGIDGSGTTTQAARLHAFVRSLGLSAVETREPSRGPVGLLIRKILSGEEKTDPAAMALLFASDRLDHLAREVVPALLAGTHVITDRYLLSSLAYQSIEIDRALVVAFNQRARRADLTLLIDVPVEVAAARRRARGGPVELFDDDAFQAQVAHNYRAEAERLRAAGEPVVIVDGTPDADQVFQALCGPVRSCIGAPVRSS